MFKQDKMLIFNKSGSELLRFIQEHEKSKIEWSHIGVEIRFDADKIIL